MAQKRMFSLNVVDTDAFLEMPITSRLLYYELGMRADDDGFVDNWKKILMFTGLKEDDLKVLIAKSFIIPFESGVIVIRHWRLNNYLQNDRKKTTIYQEELSKLTLDDSNVYTLDTTCIHSIDKNSIDKNSIVENSIDIVEQDTTTFIIKQVIDYLNERLGSNYKSNTPKTRDKIKARINEGFVLEDFKRVIDIKFIEWKGTEFEKYLRPETLFGTKFESYLNQKVKKTINEYAKTINISEVFNK